MYVFEKIIKNCFLDYTISTTLFKERLVKIRFSNKEKAKILKEILNNPNLIKFNTYRILFNRIMYGNPKKTALFKKRDSSYVLQDLTKLGLIKYNNRRIIINLEALL